MRTYKIAGALIISFLCGCALSPQIISIAPTLNSDSVIKRLNSPSITISVVDTRKNQVLGSRGGVYGETALISTADNMTENIQAALTSTFTNLGYNVSSASNATSLSVKIAELVYSGQQSNALQKITTSAVITTECKNNRFTLNNDYEITDTQDYIKAPSKSENVKIINTMMSSVLNRIYRDEKLLECLGG